MNFSWSAEQKELLDAVQRFAVQPLGASVIENDRHDRFDLDGWKKCGEFGFQGLPVPPEYGGLGAGALLTVGALERLGYACKDNGLIFSINAQDPRVRRAEERRATVGVTGKIEIEAVP